MYRVANSILHNHVFVHTSLHLLNYLMRGLAQWDVSSSVSTVITFTLKTLFYFQLSCMRQTVEGRHGFPGPRLSSFPLLYSCGITLQCYILLQFYVICTAEGTCIGAKTFAFLFFLVFG